MKLGRATLLLDKALGLLRFSAFKILEILYQTNHNIAQQFVLLGVLLNFLVVTSF